MGGTLAESRVQRGWDIVTTDRAHVQVRHLTNPSGHWVNEHLADFRTGESDKYALVIFEDLIPIAVLIFHRLTLARVGGWLGKRHSNQEVTLQLTRRNYSQLLARRSESAGMVEVVVLPMTDA
jgi:hypothetical protein